MASAFELTNSEQIVLDQAAQYIVSTREQRTQTVAEAMQAISELDPITRFVVGVALKHYLTMQPDSNPLAETWRRKVFYEAEGLYMAAGGLGEALVATGEFSGYQAFKEATEALKFTERETRHSVHYLFQWAVAQDPGCPGEGLVNNFAYPSGKMLHTPKHGINTDIILFHESLSEKYLMGLRNKSIEVKNKIDPIIVLATSDNWEWATSMLTPYQLRKLETS